MIQRIQTVYMAISAKLRWALCHLYFLYGQQPIKKRSFFTSSLLYIIFVVSALLAVFSIINFKKTTSICVKQIEHDI